MDAPVKELAKVAELIGEARAAIGGQQWERAEKALKEALALDENNHKICDLLAETSRGREEPEQAETWRKRAEETRKKAWQRQVEAEARGHHEVLGEPGRHEIP